MGFISDFKAFAMKGNVVDLAVGIIIGGAFGKIVSSLVSDIIMPTIGMLLAGVDFTDLVITLKQAAGSDPAVVIRYGTFIQAIIDFLIIALAIFGMIRLMSRLEKQKQKEDAAPAAPTKDQELLAEIRDMLKENRK